MTHVASGPRAHHSDRGRSGVSELGWLRAGTLVGLLHAVDDAVLHPQPGVSPTQHLPALAAIWVLAIVGLVAFSRSRPGVRAMLAFTFGALAVTDGGTHVIHAAIDGPAGSDVTGVLAASAGVTLLAMSALLPMRRRRAGRRSVGRTWTVRIVSTLAAVTWVGVVVLPVSVAVVQTHTVRRPVVAPPDTSYRSVSFEATDGLRISGWYRPSENRAAVIIVSSARGDRTASVEHAQLLADHGYGVLLYDARGTGESQGSPNGYGWEWERDVQGGVGFLQRQPDVDPHRIGALGLSTGANVLIQVAATHHDFAAIVSDGATGRSLADLPELPVAERPMQWTIFTAVRLLTGSSPGPPLRALVPHVSATPLLLIAAGSIPQEIPLNEVYADRAREPTELWTLPDVNHTATIREEAAAYERRVTNFLDRALRPLASPRHRHSAAHLVLVQDR
jgi:hypothetical protein